MPATIGGTPESCLLEELDERCKSKEDDIESERAALESLMRWNRVKAALVAVVRRAAASRVVGFEGFSRSFFKSSIFKNSEIFSSSAWMDSALVPVASASRPEPGWAEDVALALPLEVSSSALIPPEEGLPRRWLKALLYLEIGAGRGDAELEEAIALSGAAVRDLRADAAIDGGGIVRASARGPGPERGETPKGGSTNDGEADSGGALNGWKEMDGRLPIPGLPSPARTAARPAGLALAMDRGRREEEPGGEGDDVPEFLAARRAEIGLALVVGPTWWKVERLPYAWLGSGSSTVLFSSGTDPISGFGALVCSSLFGNDGRKISSSAPMKRELSKASASSTLKSQLVR